MRATTALKRAVQTRANHTAVVFGREKKTWAEVGDRVKKGAAALVSLGVEPRDRVAVLSLNNATYFEFLYACPWINAVLVPLNTRWSVAETERGLTDCGAKLLLVDREFVPYAEALKAKLPDLKLAFFGGGDCPAGYADYEALTAKAPPIAEIPAEPDDLWSIKYTGGTTGHPKGVMLSNRNVYTAAMIWVATGGFREESNYMHIAGFFHIVASAPAVAITMAENGGEKVDHGSGGIVPLRAA
ncbi:MAG: AMP-binding protein [Flavobacteriaceae bacterium]